MEAKQNLNIIKNISSIDIDFNRCLASKAYQLFSNNRQWNVDDYNSEITSFKESLNNIKESIKKIEDLINGL